MSRCCFTLAYLGFATSHNNIPLLGGSFILAAIGIGSVETAAVAQLTQHLHRSAFGLLAATQAASNRSASTIAGIIWTAI